MEPSEQRREPSSMGEDTPSQQVRSSYHAPLLRSHGALRDSTSLQFKSTDTTFKSDVHAKENLVAVGFGQRTGTRASGQADSDESGRSDYHAPLLRLHGALHEQTSAIAKSSDTSFQSDVHAKENIVAVGFGHRAGADSASDDAEGPGRPDYHPPLLRSHGALRDSTSLQFKSSDTSFESDVHSKEHIVAIRWGRA